MVRVRRLLVAPTLIFLTGTAQCGSTTDAPPGQALLFVDTDAPSASLASEQGRGFLTEASVDMLRIDVLGSDNTLLDSVDVAAPDEVNWPVSFGMKGISGAAVSRLRLRAFRTQRTQITTDPETGAKVFEPITGHVIDRVVEIPVPSEKGVFAFRVVLHAECRGHRTDFTRRTTCVSKGRETGGFRDGIESVPADRTPAREKLWWPSNLDRGSGDAGPKDCENVACPGDSVCIPGGFFMLGNARVVGFGAGKDAVPPHPVAMRPFCIDRSEFTVERYREAGLAWPNDPGGGTVDPYGKQLCTWFDHAAGLVPTTHSENAPVNCITHMQADQACKQVGGRLPTEAEWEYVATGLGRGSLFPWGDTPPTCESAALEQQETAFQFAPECGQVGVVPVSTREDAKQDVVAVWAKPDGTPGAEVWHMGGSLSEWTLDTFTSYGATERESNCWQRQGVLVHPSCKLLGTTMSIRGGNFIDPLEFAYAALRRGDEQKVSSELIGFRCVYPAGEEDPVQWLEPDPDEPGGSGTDAGETERPPEPERLPGGNR
jgi:formylglycine-generating enzyme required for sulfatase activity